ncbi:MAG: hypothetical protein GY850_36935 [bacterium]|nr:hypothetical protein [bacterium]
MINNGTVKYYTSGWQEFGTTAGGQTSRELGPKSYKFRMTDGGFSEDKTEDVGVDPVLVMALCLDICHDNLYYTCNDAKREVNHDCNKS